MLPRLSSWDRKVESPTDTDPVCGRIINIEKAKPSVYRRTAYYFCSRECRESFEAAPHTFLPGAKLQEGR